MRIMHYFLGFPPYRSGGMTKFAYDLMLTQIKQGNDVVALWPGQIKLISSAVVIKKRKAIKGISSFEIINPLPISYDEGIKEVDAFIKKCSVDKYKCFLKKEMPNVIHIHTLMGLHKEFLEAAKNLSIKTVFTTHDFFPICPKVTLFRKGKSCDGCLDNCPNCNATALSLNKIRLLQEPIYRVLKDSILMKKIRRKHRSDYLNKLDEDISNVSVSDYKRLRDYYISMLSMIDVIHFNSSVSKKCYLEYFTPQNSIIVPISHSDIHAVKQKKIFGDYLKITYLGPGSGAKGFFVLKDALDRLWEKRKNFELNLYFRPSKESLYMRIHERYTYEQLESVFKNTDILIVPSIWNETFGYTALEALSFGTPVIVSSTVGAKDIIADGCGVVINDINAEKIISAIEGLTKEQLEIMNNRIIKEQPIVLMSEVSQELKRLCYS